MMGKANKISNKFWGSGMYGGETAGSEKFLSFADDNKTKLIDEYSKLNSWVEEKYPAKFGKSDKGLSFFKTKGENMPTPSEFMQAYDDPDMTKELFKGLGLDVDSNPILGSENYLGLQIEDTSGIKDILDNGTMVGETARNTTDILDDSASVLNNVNSNAADLLNQTAAGVEVAKDAEEVTSLLADVGKFSDTVSVISKPVTAVLGAKDVVDKDSSGWDRFTGAVDVAGAAGADANPYYAGFHIAVKGLDLLDDLFT